MDAPKELDAGCDSHQMATTKTCAAQVRSTSFPHNTFPPMSATVQCLSCKKTTLPADHNGLKCSEGCHHVCPGSCSEQYTVKLFQRLQKGEAKHVLYRCPAKPSCNGTIKPTVSCPICLSDDIPFDHDGVRCNAGIHHVCGACAGEYAGTIATELHSTPLDQELKCFKCSDHARSGCTSEVDPDRIRRLLPADAQW